MYQYHGVGMMPESSGGELITKAAFMYHVDKSYNTAKYITYKCPSKGLLTEELGYVDEEYV